MKNVIALIFLLVVATNAYAQQDSLFDKFRRSFVRSIHINDTCVNIMLLVRMKVDNTFHLTVDKFSDNAPEHFQRELERSKERNAFNIQALEAYVKKNGQKNTQVYVPVIFLGAGFPCGSDMYSLYNVNKQLFMFDKKSISGPAFFTEPIGLVQR